MIAEQLTALKVKNAKPGRHVDGKGLCLVVKPSGARSWVLRVQVDNRRRDIGLGSVDMLTLAEAREKAAQGRKWAKLGLDPVIEWNRARAIIPTFKVAAETYHDLNRASWRNAKHAQQWINTLREYAFPKLGAMRIDAVGSADIVAVLAPIWLDKPETAGRVRQRIATVLNYAHSQHWRSSEAPMRAVAGGLPKRTKTNAKARAHHPAMPYPDLPAFMSRLAAADQTIGRRALAFTILTAARSGETRGARWTEFDLKGGLWTVPGCRMKAGEPHVVPLSSAASAILADLRMLLPHQDDDFVFPGAKGEMSDATMAKALRSTGGEGFTVHGMRSSFRDWCAEQMRTVPGEVAEAALAHTVRDKVEAAYRRTRFLEQRRDLMARWADYLARATNVVPIKAVS